MVQRFDNEKQASFPDRTSSEKCIRWAALSNCKKEKQVAVQEERMPRNQDQGRDSPWVTQTVLKRQSAATLISSPRSHPGKAFTHHRCRQGRPLLSSRSRASATLAYPLAIQLHNRLIFGI
jgi:hypothetical protein